MAVDWNRIWAGCQLAIILAIIIAMMSSMMGCIITLEKDASAGIRWGTEVAAFHNAPDGGSEAKIDLKDWLQEWIVVEQSPALTVGQYDELLAIIENGDKANEVALFIQRLRAPPAQ